MLWKRLRPPLMCLFSLSLLWCSPANPQMRSSLAVLSGLSAMVSTGALQLDCAMGVLKCSLTLNYLSRTSALRNPAWGELKGTAVGYYYYFYFSQIKRKMWLGWVENVWHQLWKLYWFAFGEVFPPPKGRPMFRRESSGWCWVLSLPSSRFLLHHGRGFSQEHRLDGTLQHCAQYLLGGFLQVSSPASGCLALYCPWDENQFIQQTVSLQNMYFSCKLTSLMDLRRARFHLVRYLFFLWGQQWQFPST